ncbi:MAG: YesL family protein [Oscillospiraceae bacterium]|nr:YesL family protein [Oscillospiraceae bacterium]
MSKWFDIDSPIMVALSRLADMFFLSVLWLVCCLPIITIGPSTAAMYYVALKWARKEDVKLSTAFFDAFKKNFKQGVALNLIFLVVGTVLALDYIIMSAQEGTYGTISSVCFFVMGMWLMAIMFYAYPLQAQFYNTVRQTLINAAQLAVTKFPVTIAVFVINLLPLIVGFISLPLLIRTIPLWLLLAPGAAACVNAKMFAKMFDKFIKEATEKTE